MNDRKKILDQYAQYVKEGMPQSEEFINSSLPAETKALKARNLAEETLANEVLKNTGIPIPDKSASLLKKEDFLNRILEERYPELKTNLEVKDLSKDNAYGMYLPKNKTIQLDKELVEKSSLPNILGTSFHEKAHQYDDDILKFHGTSDVNRASLKKLGKSDSAIKHIDPTDMYEVMGKGHHARIPNLRDADTFGLGALKSYMKNGTFKSIAPMLAKGVGTVGGGMLSLASEAADSEDAGDSLGQDAFERELAEKKRRDKAMNIATPEQKEALGKTYENIDNGMTSEQRKKALQMLLKQQENM